MQVLIKHGRPKLGVTAADRFWAQVRKTRDCWKWTGYSHNGRYGSLEVDGRRLAAHVFAYMLAHELTEPPKARVLHTCDTPLCVREDHLYLGTQKDNARDMVLRGRHGAAKLTPAQAAWCLWRDAAEIIERFGVSISHAYSLRAGRYWKGLQ